MAEFPARPLWTDAYLGDTTHLSDAEHGSYLLLLIVAWRTETTDLPDDDILLMKYARCTRKNWPQRRKILAPFFQISDGKWTQLRLLEEKHLVSRRRASAAANGVASALKRKERHATKRSIPLQRSDQQTVNGSSTPISISISSIDDDVKAREILSVAEWPSDLIGITDELARMAGVRHSQPGHIVDNTKIVKGWIDSGLDPPTEIAPIIRQSLSNTSERISSLRWFDVPVRQARARKEAGENGYERQSELGRTQSAGENVKARLRQATPAN